jgi:DNA ligase-1
MIDETKMMHGNDYAGEDVTGWLMSEKLNGCRGYWDGATMWSRGGNIINIPSAVRDALPTGCHLDGEIHAGCGGFEKARRAVQYNQWVDGVEFSVFDAPQCGGLFEFRYDCLVELLPECGAVNFVRHIECEGTSDALLFMGDVQVLGGEGVVLRDPFNIYKAGRTGKILKLKENPGCMLGGV